MRIPVKTRFCRFAPAALACIVCAAGCQQASSLPQTPAPPQANEAAIATQPPKDTSAQAELALPPVKEDFSASAEWMPAARVIRQRSTEELLDQVGIAFSEASQPTHRSVIIFPVLDDLSRIRVEGPAISTLAAYAATYVPHKHLRLQPSLVEEVFVAAQCWAPGEVVNRDAIDLCVAATEAEYYVVPRLREANGAPGHFEFTVTIYEPKTHDSISVSKATVSAAEFTDLPNKIAGEVHQLTAGGEDASQPALAALQSPTELIVLTQLLLTSSHDRDLDKAEAFVRRNPGCIPAWKLYLEATGQPSHALTVLDSLQSPNHSPALQLLVAEQLVRLNRPEESLVDLLGLAAFHADDPYYFGALVRSAIALGDDTVIAKLLEAGEQRDESYLNSLIRGRAWLAFAEKRSRALQPDQEQVRACAASAKRDLERCIALKPTDLLARSNLLALHPFLDLPYEDIDRQFTEIVRRRPRFRDAYLHKMEYLLIRHEARPSEFSDFVQACLDTQLWDDGIAQCLFEAITIVSTDPASGQFDYEVVKSPAVWEAVQLCYAALVASPVSTAEKEATAKKLAIWGAYGEHYWDASELFWGLEIDFDDGHRTDPIIGSRREYRYLQELLDAEVGYGNYKRLALAAIAISCGDLDAIETHLQRLESGPFENDSDTQWQAKTLRQVLPQAHRLQSEKDVAFSPEELDVIFPEFQPQGDKFVWTARQMFTTGEIQLPFPVGFAEISGRMEWSPEVKTVDLVAHTRAPRDRLHILYEPQSRRVQLMCNGRTIDAADILPGSQSFRLSYGRDFDVIQPCDGVSWKVPVRGTTPGGFGFRVVGTGRWADAAGTFSISELRIRQTE